MNIVVTVFKVVYTISPIILAGISNMIFVKAPFLNGLRKPMDRGVVLWDQKRLFGDNKTWKGFLGMIVLTGFWMWILGQLDAHFKWARDLNLIDLSRFSHIEQWLYGGLWGLGYVLFELPNSFIKRRIDIPPGKNVSGMVGHFFKFIDQADSVLGCLIFMLFFFKPTLEQAFLIFAVGVAIHFAVNIALYLVGLKNQPG